MAQSRLRIGTRGSPLALAQAEEVRTALVERGGIEDSDEIEIVPIRTTGDRIRDRRLLEIGGKGLFTKEIEEALLTGEIDLAVHSSKDMPAALPEGLALDVFLEREDPSDAWLANEETGLEAMPDGARIGTGSLRRAAQLLRRRADFVIVPMRGNLETRLRKLRAGHVQAMVLAVAGLRRLQRADAITSIFSPKEMVPAPGQGAIGIETRLDDARTNDALVPIGHAPTRDELFCERACLATLEGDCRTPVGILARAEEDRIEIRARLLSPDGSRCFEAKLEGRRDRAEKLGRETGRSLLEQAGPGFIESIREEVG